VAEGARITAKFVNRFPSLFHVTRRSALVGIRRNGLQPPSMLVTAQSDIAMCRNRDSWTEILNVDGPPVWLRWQRLKDHVLRTRLPQTIEPMAWRRFINGMVFLFPSLEKAQNLKHSPADAAVDQVILRFRSASLIEAGCDVRFCRWNNGYPDRSRPPRLRTVSDYRPVTDWSLGDKVQEVTVAGPIPTSVPCDVVS
jgi:hypothetical protein